MITITGGKLTTWRRMAKMTVDRIVERDALNAPCRTHEIQLGQPIAQDQLARITGVAPQAYPALADRYGHLAGAVLQIAAERPEHAEAIVGGFPDLVAEVVWALREEQARTIGDVLLRRTRLGLLAARDLCDEASPSLARVAGAMARELAWDRERSASEIARFHTEVQDEGIVVDGPAAPRGVA
jgi:glycerol-3-phosphate dehydrogenase